MQSHSYLDQLMNILNNKKGYVYFIQYQRQDTKNWYLMDIEETTPAKAIWVPYLSVAFAFSTERMAVQVINHWLYNRPVELVKMER